MQLNTCNINVDEGTRATLLRSESPNLQFDKTSGMIIIRFTDVGFKPDRGPGQSREARNVPGGIVVAFHATAAGRDDKSRVPRHSNPRAFIAELSPKAKNAGFDLDLAIVRDPRSTLACIGATFASARSSLRRLHDWRWVLIRKVS